MAKKVTRACLASACVVGLAAMGVGSTMASAVTKPESSELHVRVAADEFAVLSDGGQEMTLKAIEQSDAEELLVGFDEKAGAVYVRTVHNYTGGMEPDLLSPDGERSAPKEIAPAEGNLEEQEVLPFSSLSQVSPSEMELGTVIAVTSNSATLTWNAPEGTERVIVLLNDKVAPHTEDGVSFENLEPGALYEVTVGFYAGLGAEQVAIREDTHVIQTLPENMSSPLTDEKAAAVVKNVGVKTRANALRLVTFLGENYYEAGYKSSFACNTPAAWFFKGDNRSYSMPAGPTTVYSHASHRTGLEIIPNWDAPAGSSAVIVNKSVGQTKRYDASKNYIDTRTASSGGMVVQNPTISGNNYIKFGVSHEIGDPFCDFGAIRYSLPLVQMYKSGTISISGSRQPIPNFEFYGSFSQSSGVQYWATLYRGAEGPLACLLGTCISQNISKTHTAN